MRIVVTGHMGLVGRHLSSELKELGHTVIGVDIKDGPEFNVSACDIPSCDGIVHLAACSRVIWGEARPVECIGSNVAGVMNILKCAGYSKEGPWVLFASSREVYGSQVGRLSEDAERLGKNVYATTKILGEDLCSDFVRAGGKCGVVRLSGVYGDVDDHRTRVIPAFCRAASVGDDLTVRGGSKVFDFVHVQDVVDGLVKAIGHLNTEGSFEPVHFVSGRGTSLYDLAEMAMKTAEDAGVVRGKIIEQKKFDYEIDGFVGDPGRAEKMFGWSSKIPISEGVRGMVRGYLDAFSNFQPCEV